MTFVNFEKNSTKKSSEAAVANLEPQSFRGDDQKDDSAERDYLKSFAQGSQGSQNKSKTRNGQAAPRVQLGAPGAHSMGTDQDYS